ncbi:MAG: zf-HC2 domain-containing protein [Gemmatimonadaceae bacterium]
MRDCSNATMRDRLPDLLHERLPVAERADVRAHVAACPECRAELELLTRIQAATVTPRVDTSRIVAALPPHRGGYRGYRGYSWQRAAYSPMLRIAAAVVLLAGGATIGIRTVDRGDDILVPTPSRDTSPIAVAPVPPRSDRGATTAPVQRVSTNGPAELAMGEMLDDLSDSDLRALLDVVGKLEAMTPAETEIVVPAVGRGGA